MNIWVIYDSPTDFPGKFVTRRFDLYSPSDEVYIEDSLDEIRKRIPPGLYRLPRQPLDEEIIVETWF